ncbi:unnamed protein product, partial [Effrenium voratum]
EEASETREATSSGGFAEAAAAVHLELQLRSKERLRRLIRTGQVDKAKKEMLSSLPPLSDARPGDEEVANFCTKEQALERRQQGDAEEALRMMGRQRTELSKVRRTLEHALDRRRDSLRRAERLQQVKQLIGDDRLLNRSKDALLT